MFPDFLCIYAKAPDIDQIDQAGADAHFFLGSVPFHRALGAFAPGAE